MLFLSYVIGLLFTLRTHAAVIWSSEFDEKKAAENLAVSQTSGQVDASVPAVLVRQNTTSSTTAFRPDIRDSQLYHRILGQSLSQAGITQPTDVRDAIKPDNVDSQSAKQPSVKSPHIVPPRSLDGDVPSGFHLQGLSDHDNSVLTQQVAEMAATAAAVATRDATKAPHRAARMASETGKPPTSVSSGNQNPLPKPSDVIADGGAPEVGTHAPGGGHDAPNWSRTKSAVILVTATLAYAIIAEILVDTVDAVLENIDIDEKFLGITLFALVPNTTEFLVSLLSFHNFRPQAHH